MSGTVDRGFNKSGLTFSGPGQTKSFTVTQPGHTGPFIYTDLCRSGEVAVTTKDFITFTVTAQARGGCTSLITGLQGSTETVIYTVP